MIPGKKENPKSILWIALFRGIGDAVLFYPTLERCMEIFPGAQISLIIFRKGIEEVLRLYGFKGTCLVLPQSRIHLIPWIFRVGIRSYSMVFDASSMDQTHLTRWLSLIFSKKDRVGYQYGSSSWLYNIPLGTGPIAADHQKDIFAELLRPYDPDSRRDLTAPPDSNLGDVSDMLPDYKGKRIVIHLGARDKFGSFVKSWPLAKYVELIQRTVKITGVQIVILGDEKENKALLEFDTSLNHPGIINLTGKASIGQLFSIIRTADLFIGNNSGPLHIAACYHKPIITFAGGVPLLRWGPLSKAANVVAGLDKKQCVECKDWNCDKQGKPCLEAVTVEEVYDEVIKLL
jgi:ADP-heptose:LPS heptosyltransferase